MANVANFSINSEDGWVKVVTGSSAYVRIRAGNRSMPFYVTTAAAASTPAPSERGFKVDGDDDFEVYATVADDYYVRVPYPSPDQDLLIDVFHA